MRPRRTSESRRWSFRQRDLWSRGALAGLCAVLLALGASNAHADEGEGEGEQIKEYEQAVRKATQHWKAERFAAARAEYQRAYQIHPEPILLFNIGSTYRREKNHRRALTYYERFLQVAPQDEPRRKLAEDTVRSLRQRLAGQRESGDDGERGAEKPAEKKDLEVRSDPKDDGAGAATAEGPTLVAGDDRSMSTGQKMMWGGIGSGSVGVVMLAYGLFEGNRARDRNSEFENLPAGTVWTPEMEERYDEGEKFERRAIIFSVLGTAAVATGATLFYLGHRKQKSGKERQLGVTPYAGQSEAGVALIGTF